MNRAAPPTCLNTEFCPPAKAEKTEKSVMFLPQAQLCVDKNSTALPSTLLNQRPAYQTQHKGDGVLQSNSVNGQREAPSLTIPADILDKLESCRISSQLILGYQNYAKALLRDYPPESHRLVMFGAQNVLLSGVFATMIPQEKSRDYIRQLPFTRLNSYYYQHERNDCSMAAFQTFMVKAIKAVADDCDSGDKKIILIRVMSLGLTANEATETMMDARKKAGIHYDFDYLDPGSIYDVYRHSLQLLSKRGLRLRTAHDMKDHVLDQIHHSRLMEFNPCLPFELSLTYKNPSDSDARITFKFNPDFAYLVQWLRDRLAC